LSVIILGGLGAGLFFIGGEETLKAGGTGSGKGNLGTFQNKNQFEKLVAWNKTSL